MDIFTHKGKAEVQPLFSVGSTTIKRKMVISQIRSLYRDANDLLRPIMKRVYEQWNAPLGQWQLKKIEFLFPKV